MGACWGGGGRRGDGCRMFGACDLPLSKGMLLRRQFPYLVNIMGGFAGLMIGWVTRNLWFNMVSPADPFSLKSIVNVTLIGVHFFLPGYYARRALPANPEDASLALLLIHFLLLALMFDERASSWTRVGNGMLWSRGICSFSACWLS